MRHRKLSTKLNRSTAHRNATMASLVCSLIAEKRIRTTVAKAKSAQRSAERLVTTARQGTLAARRRVISRIGRPAQAAELFETVVPAMEGRPGGFTRVIRLGRRTGDGAEMALLEWVGIIPPDKRKKPKAADDAKKS